MVSRKLKGEVDTLETLGQQGADNEPYLDDDKLCADISKRMGLAEPLSKRTLRQYLRETPLSHVLIAGRRYVRSSAVLPWLVERERRSTPERDRRGRRGR